MMDQHIEAQKAINPGNSLEVILASPRGFCAGVDRAITIVEKALAKFGPPIYVRHEIVHNRHVVSRLREKGVIFVDNWIRSRKVLMRSFPPTEFPRRYGNRRWNGILKCLTPHARL